MAERDDKFEMKQNDVPPARDKFDVKENDAPPTRDKCEGKENDAPPTRDKFEVKQNDTPPARDKFEVKQNDAPPDQFNSEPLNKDENSKSFDDLIRQTKIELIKQNENFINLNTDPSCMDQVFENFTSAELNELDCKVRSGALVLEDLSGLIEHVNKTEVKRYECRSFLSRTPITCPISKCIKTIGVTSILSHFLRDHHKPFPWKNHQEIGNNHRYKMQLNESFFNFGEIECLGVLLYSGQNNNHPAEMGFCLPNSFLPTRYHKYIYHLPLIIFGAKTCLSSLLEKEEMASKYFNPEDIEKQILVLWLASVETVKPIHYSLTAYDFEGRSSKSTIIKLRDLNHSQKLNQVMTKYSNYLMLSRGELNLLTNCGKKNFNLEVYVHEYEE